MIIRDDGFIQLECDDCGCTTLKAEAEGNAEVLRIDAKAQGWRRFERDGQWRDSCADCVAERVVEKQRGWPQL